MGTTAVGRDERVSHRRKGQGGVFADAFQKGVSTYPAFGSVETQISDNDQLTPFSWIASDKSSRIPVSTFQTALKLHGIDVDSDEVECMVANMIFRVSPRLGR